MTNRYGKTQSKISLNHKGFTLIESLIVLALIGVLAVIAVSNNTQHAIKTHQTIAKDVLLRMQGELERSFQLEQRFSNEAYTRAENYFLNTFERASADRAARGRYRLNAEIQSETEYLIHLEATERQIEADGQCNNLSISSQISTELGTLRPSDCWTSLKLINNP